MKVEIPANKVISGDKQPGTITMETGQADRITNTTKYITKLATHDALYEVNAIDLIKALEYLLKCATAR